LIAAAEGLARRCAERIEAAAAAGEDLDVVARGAIRGEAGFAVRLCREAVAVLSEASGASSIMLHVPIQRFYRDINALSLHAVLAPNTNLEVAGRIAVGLPPMTSFL
jgi:alkylation response protein AidB-like acyl-CoA dehydrogenase